MAEAAAHTTLAFGGNALVSDAPLLDEMIGGIARPLGWALRSIGGTTRSMACVNWINVGVVHANLTRLPLSSQTKKYPNSCVQARRPPLLPPSPIFNPSKYARARPPAIPSATAACRPHHQDEGGGLCHYCYCYWDWTS